MNHSLNKSLLVLLLLLGVMGSADAVAQRAGQSRGLTEESRLQARVESAYVAASREFADDILGANVPENPIHSARSVWQARIARCLNEGCRRTLLMDELRRLR